MSDTPLSYLFSRSKWNKLLLLLKEAVLSVGFRVGKISGIGIVDGEAEQTSQDVTTTGDQNHAIGSETSETIAKQFTWNYEARVAVSPEVLSHTALKYHQDAIVDSGEVHTDHTYRLSEVCYASMCSNGATHVSIYGADDRCIPEFSYVKYGRNRPQAKNKKRQLPINRFISGTTLNLYGNVENTAGNYGHWMIDGVGLLYLALREYGIDEIDYFLVPVLRYDFQKESLLAMGIPEHKIIELPALSCFRFERLICASAPRGQSSCVTPGWLIDGYRKALLVDDKAGVVGKGRRLYISRRDASSRKFINEDEIVNLLNNAGFETIELSKFGFSEKIELFAQADIIVGLTGAGLTNLMFCSKDTHVVEIFPTSFVTYFYASMAGYLGLDYRALIFENDSVMSGLNKYYGNLSLDPKLLEKSLEGLL